jgi:gamma-glutamyl-gamma-aminobutyrate hydrolase PuuD
MVDEAVGAGVPLIGISSYLQEATFDVWQVHSALVPAVYLQAVERAGGRPLVIPPTPVGVTEVVDVLDGLVLSGGGDIDPQLFGADAHPALDQVDIRRDDGELALLRAALDRDLPVLGVCRGVQLLNVAYGGDILQHVPELVGHDDHKQQAGVFGRHAVRTAAGTRLADLVGEAANVPSHHHQAVGAIGKGLVASAFAEDGLTEAVEDPARPFCIGVQWHPEEHADDVLVAAFVESARARMGSRR